MVSHTLQIITCDPRGQKAARGCIAANATFGVNLYKKFLEYLEICSFWIIQVQRAAHYGINLLIKRKEICSLRWHFCSVVMSFFVVIYHSGYTC